LTTKYVFSIDDYAAAIAALIHLDLVTEISVDKLQNIIDYLKADPAIGPINGTPAIGTFQFSVRYVRLLQTYLQYHGNGFDETWIYEMFSDERQVVYGTTRRNCLEFLRDQLSPKDDDWKTILQIRGPFPCGPWRSDWWSKYESGHTIELIRTIKS
jgi:hypothetical protein